MFPMGGPEVPSSVSLRTIPAVTAPPPTHRAAPAVQRRPLTPTRAHLTSVRDDNAKERGTSPLNTPSPQCEAGDQNAGDRLLFLAGSERDTDGQGSQPGSRRTQEGPWSPPDAAHQSPLRSCHQKAPRFPRPFLGSIHCAPGPPTTQALKQSCGAAKCYHYFA